MILVTGGAGFIGSHTVAELESAGHAVRVLDNLFTGRRENLASTSAELVVGDINDPALLDRCLEGCRGVIHLAARPGVPESCAQPVDFDEVNVHGTVRVFEHARRAGVDRVVYASSSAVYGSHPAPEKTEDLPLLPESPYAVAKAACELYGAVFTATLGLPCTGLRYFNVFGPRQDPKGPYAAVIPRFVEHALRGEPLPVYGDGEQSRDFVSVRDVARINRLALFAPGGAGEVYNVGTGRRTTVNELADHVRRAVGIDVQVEHHAERPGDIRHSLCDRTRARHALGWEPVAEFAESMAETITWYRGLLREGGESEARASGSPASGEVGAETGTV